MSATASTLGCGGGRHRRHWGYSMLEVLVVLALLATLTAILMPAYGAIKKRTKDMGCVNNLRQIGSAMTLYIADHGHFPHSSHIKLWCDWGEFLIPYFEEGKFRNTWIPGEPWATGLLKKSGTFQHLAHEVGQGSWNKNTGQVLWPGWPYFTCPAGPESRHGVPPWSTGWVHVYGRGYAVNEYILPYGRWSNSPWNYTGEGVAEAAYNAGTYIPFPPVKPGDLNRAGTLIVLCDVGATAAEGEPPDTMRGPLYDGPNGIVNRFVADPVGEPANATEAVTTASNKDNDIGPGDGWPVYYRHRGICNALMADGHVQGFRNGEIQRRNFVSKGRTKRWGFPTPGPADFVWAEYP